MMCLYFYIFCLYLSITGGIITSFVKDWGDLSIFNPKRNYDKWETLNWFGIIVITLFLNIIFIPYAVIYWVYILFTIGRK